MRRVLLISFVLLSFSTALFAGPPALLRLGNDKPVPLLSFSWGVANASAMTAPQATMVPLQFAKALDASTGSDYDACMSGRHIPQVTIDLLDSKGKSVAQIKLTDVVVTSFTLTSGPDPVESVTLGYTRAQFVAIAY
jgi:type VI protein secretion system component Hcp